MSPAVTRHPTVVDQSRPRKAATTEKGQPSHWQSSTWKLNSFLTHDNPTIQRQPCLLQRTSFVGPAVCIQQQRLKSKRAGNFHRALRHTEQVRCYCYLPGLEHADLLDRQDAGLHVHRCEWTVTAAGTTFCHGTESVPRRFLGTATHFCRIGTLLLSDRNARASSQFLSQHSCKGLGQRILIRIHEACMTLATQLTLKNLVPACCMPVCLRAFSGRNWSTKQNRCAVCSA